jgi:hypothetical protein
MAEVEQEELHITHLRLLPLIHILQLSALVVQAALMELTHLSDRYQLLSVAATVVLIQVHPARVAQVVDRLAQVAEQVQAHPGKVLQVVMLQAALMAQAVAAEQVQ